MGWGREGSLKQLSPPPSDTAYIESDCSTILEEIYNIGQPCFTKYSELYVLQTQIRCGGGEMSCQRHWTENLTSTSNAWRTFHMDSRKMVLMNLFAGPEWRADIENRLTETGGGGEEGERKTNGVAWKHLHYPMKSRRPVGICYMTPRIQTGALWPPRGVGGRFKREWTYVHLWLIHTDVWQKGNQYCKAIILQLKIH